MEIIYVIPMVKIDPVLVFIKASYTAQAAWKPPSNQEWHPQNFQEKLVVRFTGWCPFVRCDVNGVRSREGGYPEVRRMFHGD